MLEKRSDDGRLPVVTGLGVVSCIGLDAPTFWAGVLSGQTGVRQVTRFDTSAHRNRVGCEIVEELPTDPRWAGLPRASGLAAVAAEEALRSSALPPDGISALCVGTTMGDMGEFERPTVEVGHEVPGFREQLVRGNFARRIAQAIGVDGAAVTIATSCSAGNLAIARALDLIRTGAAERVLAGGVDAFSRVAFTGFTRMRAMAPERCEPFGRHRKGMLLGEGAGFLTIETRASAERRAAPILAAIAGVGLSCDASHVATPDSEGRGAVVAMRKALENADLTSDRVDYVCAHGTGTLRNDLGEARAYRTVFGSHRPPLSSLKALTGHPLGAAGAIEAAACVLSLHHQRLIPAWHVPDPDPACDVKLSSPADRPVLDVVVNNAFAFGGNNSCIALVRCH